MPFSTDLSTSPLPDSRITFRRHHANEPSKTTPLGRTSPDQAKEQMDAARRRARQSIREYELICGCCSSACVQCLGLLASLALALHCTATAWELSDLDHSHAATPQRVTRASCVRLPRSVLGAACRCFAGSS